MCGYFKLIGHIKNVNLWREVKAGGGQMGDCTFISANGNLLPHPGGRGPYFALTEKHRLKWYGHGLATCTR